MAPKTDYSRLIHSSVLDILERHAHLQGHKLPAHGLRSDSVRVSQHSDGWLNVAIDYRNSLPGENGNFGDLGGFCTALEKSGFTVERRHCNPPDFTLNLTVPDAHDTVVQLAKVTKALAKQQVSQLGKELNLVLASLPLTLADELRQSMVAGIESGKPAAAR